MFAVPAVEAPPIKLHASHAPPSYLANMQYLEEKLHQELMPKTTFMHPFTRGMRMQFPEVRLIQYDCGKQGSPNQAVTGNRLKPLRNVENPTG